MPGTSVEVRPQVNESMAKHADVAEIGKRITLARREGVACLRGKRIYVMSVITNNCDPLGLAFGAGVIV